MCRVKGRKWERICVCECVCVCVCERERERGRGIQEELQQKKRWWRNFELEEKKDFPIMRNPVCARLCVLIACDRSDMWTIPAQWHPIHIWSRPGQNHANPLFKVSSGFGKRNDTISKLIYQQKHSENIFNFNTSIEYVCFETVKHYFLVHVLFEICNIHIVNCFECNWSNWKMLISFHF